MALMGLTDEEELEFTRLLKQTVENTTQREWERVIELNKKMLDWPHNERDEPTVKGKEPAKHRCPRCGVVVIKPSLHSCSVRKE